MTAALRRHPPDAHPDAGPCPSCGAREVQVFFEQPEVPVTSNRLFATRAEAVECARGDVRLGFCHACGLVTNVAFRGSGVVEHYESSQAASARFRAYAADLARDWVIRHGLRGRTVLEVGCGRGEFLAAFCQESGGRGVGVDPVLAAGPAASPATDGDTDGDPGIDAHLDGGPAIEWVAAPFRAEHLPADVAAVICRHTLEHLPEPRAFLRELRNAIGGRDVPVLLEVPDVAPIFRDGAFWDVYYEHCNYFSQGSLSRLLLAAGFTPGHLQRTYQGQYLVADAHPAPLASSAAPRAKTAPPVLDDRRVLWHAAVAYAEEHARRIEALRAAFEEMAGRGQRVVFWGAGSKATAYLVALEATPGRVSGAGAGAALVDCVVDINARKQGTYIAGTGHPVVAPEHLCRLRPDVVVLMNPVYRDEVAAHLESLGVAARLVDPEAPS